VNASAVAHSNKIEVPIKTLPVLFRMISPSSSFCYLISI